MRIWICFLLVLPLGLGSCRYMMGKRVRGNGVIRTEEHSVSSFKNVDVSGTINLYISQGDQKPVRLEGDENLLRLIEVVEEGDRLIVREMPGYNLDPTGDLRVYVTAPEFSHIRVSGAGDIVGQNKIVNNEALFLHSSGAGDIKMNVDAPELTAQISGSGSIDLQGQTKDVDLGLSGAGSAHCYDLLAENTRVEISGAGSAEVYASVKLEARVSGAGSVSYKGNATTVEQHVSGVGSVNKVN